MLVLRHFVLVLISLAIAQACPSESRAEKSTDLKTILEKDLRARLPSEFAFIARVMDKVDRGELPEKLVRRTHVWARHKPRHPYRYFEQAMRLQARRLGIKL